MEMKRAFLVFALFFSASAGALSLDQLAAMQTFVRAEVDGARICPDETGGLSESALAGLPMLLEGRVREALDSLSSEARAELLSEKHVAGCPARCRCGIYADWLGSAKTVGAEDLRKSLLERERRAGLSPKKVAACAKANRDWICKHPVFRALVSEAKKNAKGGGE